MNRRHIGNLCQTCADCVTDMGERFILQKQGYSPIIVTRFDAFDSWYMLRNVDVYGDEHWEPIPKEVKVEEAIALYQVDKPIFEIKQPDT